MTTYSTKKMIVSGLYVLVGILLTFKWLGYEWAIKLDSFIFQDSTWYFLIGLSSITGWLVKMENKKKKDDEDKD